MKNMSTGLKGAGLGLAFLLVAGAVSGGRSIVNAQSLSYSSGQDISPAYEGWEQDADGKYFLFGYMNRNWEEEIDLPVGPDNGFSPGPADRGQPTHFLPRRNRFVFRVPVPKDFTEKDELIWTINVRGKTDKAYATLRADYLVDDVVKASETGALGAGTSSPEVRSNKAPTVSVQGSKTLTAKVGEPLTLVSVVTDDGIPKPRRRQTRAAAAARPGNEGDAPAARRNPAMIPPSRITVGKVTGLHLSWLVYRGEGDVTFSPEQVKPWEDTRAGANSPWAPLWTPPAMPADGRIPVEATFAKPGTYVLRSMADDGALLGWDSVTVTVTP